MDFRGRLTTETRDEVTPSWSADGRWIYFSSNRTGSHEVHKIPAEGGDVVQVTTNGGTSASESPDGEFLYFAKSRSGIEAPHGIWRMPIDGGDEVQMHDRGEYSLWEVKEEGIYVLNRAVNPAVVELVDVTTGEVTQVAVLDHEPSMYGFSVSPDRRLDTLRHR